MSKMADQTNELKQDDMDRIIDAGRDAHLRKYLAESDEMLTSELAKRYRDVVPAARIEAMLSMPTRFEDREAFDRALAATGAKPGGNDRVLGYSRYDVEPAHVAVDHLEIPKTIAHERLHQLSDPRAKRELGGSLYEGITEDLAIDTIGAESPRSAGRCYPAERAVAHEIRELAGDATVEQAYFGGDAAELRRRLVEKLGPGGMERLQKQITDLSKLE